ncbi:MAG: AbrB/MazE/SpoVT family DNA-binding domain-containing protein [Propionibacteriaceae bacterium]|jgi:AbrB family looped-hinge helix DNA binding protein|nr:AbrB/MazE/SpoVT family DNA-binding domain-containing protein [Propionibacteriaceae bacterium]
MTITMDRAGRVMLPKAVRERHGLTEGAKLDIIEEGALIIITPQPAQIEIVEEDGRLVAVGGAPVTDQMVREILESIRR